ncbi:hypothetical protein [Nitrosophilus alvini]|uniref:hypothetical protein n=1 Tax=Nitrosophilus alvini TaxID=2714855 RepID=UPI00190D25E6|nr:hypothetical protein [Nitrosophilus alvini]
MSASVYKAAGTSIFLEIGALGALKSTSAAAQMAGFFTFHSLASALIAYAVWILLPKKYKNPKFYSFSLIFIVCFVMPLFSYIGFIVYNIILRTQKETKPLPINKANFSDIIAEKIVVHKRNYGESSLKVFALKKELPTELRLKAFLLLTELKTPESIQLIKSGLKDPNDEIRLLSFSVINRLEKELSTQIHDKISLIEKTKDKRQKAKAHKELARLYWEYIYIGLADSEYKKFILQEIEKHALSALDELKTDPFILITLGRLCLIKKDIDSAYELFKKAVYIGSPEYKTVPFLAEIHFYRKEFAKVRKIFSNHPHMRYDPQLYPIIALWEEKV